MLGDVCRLRRPRPGGVDFVVVLQDSLHDDLPTRVVAPLVRPADVPRPLAGLHPAVVVDGERRYVLVNELASLPAAALHAPHAALTDARARLVAALDLLVTGI